MATLVMQDQYILQDLEWIGVEIIVSAPGITLTALQVKPTLEELIKQKQLEDQELQKVRENIEAGKLSEFKIASYGVVRFRDWLCVPSDSNVKKKILEEAHSSLYTIHPGGTKMYQDIKKVFWWNNMKREIERN